MSTKISPGTPLPGWIMSAYNKRNPTYDSITQVLGAKPVTNIETVVVGGFYLAKMPWTNYTGYYKAIDKMKDVAEKDQTRINRIEDYKQKREEYLQKYKKIEDKYDIPYYKCLLEEEYDEYFRLQKLLGGPESYKAGVAQSQIYAKHAGNEDKCKQILNGRVAELDRMKVNAPYGYKREEDRLGRYNILRDKPLLFIQVTGINVDGTIICYGYNVKTGIIYSDRGDTPQGEGQDDLKTEVFLIDFREVELYSIDEQVIKDETVAARAKFDKGFVDPLKEVGRVGGKRRSKTNGRFRKYRSRRNISSRTQRRKKTQRRQRR